MTTERPRRLRDLIAVPLCLALCFAFSAATATFAAQADSDTWAGFDAWVEEVMAEWLVPGIAVSVVKDGEVVLAKGYGFRDYENKVPVTADTLFAIGSNSKSFTALLLAMMVEAGELEWDEPIRTYMPDFQLHDPVATAQMTARDLVTHRSGLPRHDLVWLATGRDRRGLYERMRYLEPSQPFRGAFQYQNLMFMTAGYLAGQVGDSTWEELTRQRILDPLGMTRSNFSVDDMAKDADHSFAYMDFDDEITKVPFRNIDAVGPAGSINSSVNEMAKYVQFHIDYGKVGEEQILSEASARAMQSPQMVMNGPLAAAVRNGDEIGDPTYGLGLMVGTYRGRKHVRHGGGIDGFISAMEWLPNERIGVTVLSNTSGSGTVPQLVVRNVFDRLLGLDQIDWAERARKQEAEAEKMAEQMKEQRAQGRKDGTKPSHSLDDYVGSYEHPGYGMATIGRDGDALQVEVIGFDVPLEHYHYNVFMVPYDLEGPMASLGGTRIAFSYDLDGDIDSLEIPLESSVSAIQFARLGDETMNEIAFLERMVGQYEIAGQLVTVALAGDKLTLTVPGQPVYTLVPDRDTTFKLEGADGFSVEFDVEGDSSPASAATLHQPNGSFTAERKAAA